MLWLTTSARRNSIWRRNRTIVFAESSMERGQNRCREQRGEAGCNLTIPGIIETRMPVRRYLDFSAFCGSFGEYDRFPEYMNAMLSNVQIQFAHRSNRG
jgi:hypothetical protein